MSEEKSEPKQMSRRQALSMLGLAAAIGYAVPTVWLGLLLIILFAVKFRDWGLPYLPVGGVRDLYGNSGPADRIRKRACHGY